MTTSKMKMAAAAAIVLAAAGLAVAISQRAQQPVAPDGPPAGERVAAADEKPRDPDEAGRPVKPVELTPQIKALVKSNSDFALDLYARLAGANDNEGKSLFFSPYSVSSALAMCFEGARAETAEQMGKVLRFPQTARRAGEEAARLPWDTALIHEGMAGLNEEFNAGSRPAPKEVQEKIDALRKQLKEANDRAAAAMKADNIRVHNTAAKKAQAVAAELNPLLSKYSQYELRVANALWGEKTYPFKPSYFDTVNKYYKTGGVFPVDFRNDFPGARKKINGWVEEQTHDRIKDLVPDMPPEVSRAIRLILTNAIYVKGEWAEIFQAAQTKDDDFLLAGGDKVRVPMMRHADMGKGVRYAAFQGDGTFFNTPARVRIGAADPENVYPDDRGFAVLELPYKGERLSMLVVAPRSADGLPALEKKLNSANLEGWVGKLQQRPVHVFLPKFKLETTYEMGDTLQQMGMKRAFKDPRAADGAQFNGMSQSEDPAQMLYITRVIHKAFVEVNEKGTEAAAATAIIMGVAESAPVTVPFTPTFKADRPFLFLIRDRKTGSVLFLGRMTNPAAAKA
jgi:serine protease inhibitor